MGFDPSALLNNTAQGAAASLVSGAIGQGFSALSAARDWKYAKKLMARQHAYELENLAAQDKYQRQLALDASSLRKRSLQNAGYSTADPEGTGTVAPSISAPSSSASGMSIMQNPTFAPGMTITDLANANLMNSQAELNRIEAKYREEKLRKEISKIQVDIKQVQDLLPEQVKKIQAETADLVASKQLKESQAKEVDESVKKIMEEIKGLQIENTFKPDLRMSELRKIESEIYLNAQKGRFDRVVADLADVGIIVGADWMTQLAAVIHKGTAGDLVDKIVQAIRDVFSKAGEHGGSLFDKIHDGIHNSKMAKEFRDGLNRAKDPKGRSWDFQDK